MKKLQQILKQIQPGNSVTGLPQAVSSSSYNYNNVPDSAIEDSGLRSYEAMYGDNTQIHQGIPISMNQLQRRREEQRGIEMYAFNPQRIDIDLPNHEIVD